MRYGLLVLLLLVGCTSPSGWLRKVSSVVKTPATEVRQSGDAAVPAQATVSTTQTSAPIPPGSKITIETPVAKEGALATPPPVLVTTTTTEHSSAPTSFQPPPPPSPSELATAQTKIWFWIGTIIGGAAAIFGLVRDWNLVMWGGIAVAGACLFAIFVQDSPWVLPVIGIGVALKFAGPYLWHTKLKGLSTDATPKQ